MVDKNQEEIGRTETTCRLCRELMGWPVVQRALGGEGNIPQKKPYAFVHEPTRVRIEAEHGGFYFWPYEQEGADMVWSKLPSPKELKGAKDETGETFLVAGDGWQGEWCDNIPEAATTAAINFLDTKAKQTV